jgi:hypothetical protein
MNWLHLIGGNMKKVILGLVLVNAFSAFAGDKLCGKIERLVVAAGRMDVQISGAEQTLFGSSVLNNDGNFVAILAAAKASDIPVCLGRLGKINSANRQGFGTVEIK